MARHLSTIVTGVTVDTACVDVVMAHPAQPQQVVGVVIAALGAKRHMVRVRAGAAFADAAGFPEHLEAEAEDRLRVDDALRWARISHGR
jgi:hypothetical protein